MSKSSRAQTLQSHFNQHNPTPNAPLRPVLTSLNGDNSWLISFPRPAAERASPGSKTYFHVVSDAWLVGKAITYAWWFVRIPLVSPAAIPSGDAVERVVMEIEAAAGGSTSSPDTSVTSPIDAIFVNLELPDHLHEETLRSFRHDIPIFATFEAAAIIRPWNYFHQLSETRDFDASHTKTWQSLHPEGLPDWLSVFRCVGHHYLNFATMIIYSSETDSKEVHHEAIIYSPHGIKTNQPSIQALLGTNGEAGTNLNPPIRVLAILHALKDSYALWTRTTLGVMGGLALERMTRPKYWVKSHDTNLIYWGVVSRLINVVDVARSLQSGLDEEGNA